MIDTKKKLQFFVLAIFFLAGAAFAQTNPAVQLGKLLQNFKTYQAKFNQITLDANGAVKQKTYGSVMIKRPGGFRWETETPTKQIIIINGNTLWTYDVDLQQATKRTLKEKTNINPALLLSGSVSNLTKQFNIYRLPAKPHTFLLKPKQENAVNFKSLELRFTKDRLTRMKVVNSLSEVSVFSFSHIRINQEIASNLFQFKPPAGVDVVSQ